MGRSSLHSNSQLGSKIKKISAFVLFASIWPSVAGARSSTLWHAPPSAESQQDQIPTSFEVSSIRRNPNPSGWKLQFTADGLDARGVTLKQIIEDAFGIYNDDRIIGGPSWIDSDKFDVQARVDDSFAKHFDDLTIDQRRVMLQSLLASRFGLVFHRSTQERPIFALEIAKGGPLHLQKTELEDVYRDKVTHSEGIITRSSSGELAVEGFSMGAFAHLLSTRVGKVVSDRTGLTGYYSFALHWTPEIPTNPGRNPESTFPQDPAELSIFMALQRQLGLKLNEIRGPVEILVIDRAQLPTID